MQTVIDSPDSVKDCVVGFARVLPSASRTCPRCSGRLIGHGRRRRWVVSPEGVFRIPIQRLICKKCGKTFSLLPGFLYAFYQCARSLAARVRSLRQDGLRSMSDVRYMLVGACSALAGRLHLTSLYRWARLASP
ncbi:MAG: DUF6431 domain-containing protein [Planctomycetota bacterium]|jgi:hypothetical protein